MKKDLLFNFIENKEAKTISIVREFAANIQSVWDAWTKSEILDQWWAPKPYHVKTKTFDFIEGGMWLYAMVGPTANDIHWSRTDYKKIKPLRQIICQDAFSDENGNIDDKMPRALWTNNFMEDNGVTTVNSILEFNNSADMDMLLKMGFKEGLGMGYSNLDELLLKLHK